MKNLILAAVSLTLTSSLFAEEAPKAETKFLETLLTAAEENDLDKFESICDDNMKEAMTEDTLNEVSSQVSPLMKEGYKKVYMGSLDRGGFKTYFWKIDFDQDDTPDVLAELSTSEDKVTGFILR